MKELKKYVKNRARPEGCIAKNYLANEYVKFCNRSFRIDEGGRGGPVGKAN